MYSLPFRDIAVAEITQNMDIMTAIPAAVRTATATGSSPFRRRNIVPSATSRVQRPVVLAMPRLEMIEMRAIPSMKTGQMRGIRTQFMNQAGVRYSFFHSIIA